MSSTSSGHYPVWSAQAIASLAECRHSAWWCSKQGHLRPSECLCDCGLSHPGAGTPEHCVILKGDVQGSVDAMQVPIGKFQDERAKLSVHTGIGNVTPGDIQMAKLTKGKMYCLHTDCDRNSKEMAEKDNVSVFASQVNYKLMETMKELIESIVMALVRITRAEQLALVPRLLCCLEGRPVAKQSTQLRVITPLLGSVELPESQVNRASWLMLRQKKTSCWQSPAGISDRLPVFAVQEALVHSYAWAWWESSRSGRLPGPHSCILPGCINRLDCVEWLFRQAGGDEAGCRALGASFTHHNQH